MVIFAVPRRFDAQAWTFSGREFCLQKVGVYMVPGGWSSTGASVLWSFTRDGEKMDVATVNEVDPSGKVKASFIYSPIDGLVEFMEWQPTSPAAVSLSLSGKCGVGCAGFERYIEPSTIIKPIEEPQALPGKGYCPVKLGW
jgi:hypothetical protein